MRERHAALLVVVMYLSPLVFVSPLIATKHDQLLSLPPEPSEQLLRFFRSGQIRTVQLQRGRKEKKQRGRKRRDSGGIVGLKFKLGTAVVP